MKTKADELELALLSLYTLVHRTVADDVARHAREAMSETGFRRERAGRAAALRFAGDLLVDMLEQRIEKSPRQIADYLFALADAAESTGQPLNGKNGEAP